MSLFDVLDKPTTVREFLNPRYDTSIWQALARAVRGLYRRRFYPNGPEWFAQRISSVNLIAALHGCSRPEAEEIQRSLDESRLKTWLTGF